MAQEAVKKVPLLELKDVGKSFFSSAEQKNQVLKHLDLVVEAEETVAILGPSGCGKSTLINMIAGFEKMDQGEVLLEGRQIQGPSSERGVVFQNAVLFPWLTVEENLAFGLKRNKVPKEKRKELVGEFLKMVHLEKFSGYYASELSGGMQQRVSLARTLVLHPKILLMDEPFSALDPVLRHKMQALVLDIREELRQTILIVTHDIEEALLLADRIYVLGPCPQGIVKEIQMPGAEREKLRMSPELLELKNQIMELFIQIY